MRLVSLLLVCLLIWNASAKEYGRGKEYHPEGDHGYYERSEPSYPNNPSYVPPTYTSYPGPQGPPGPAGPAGPPGPPGGGSSGVCPAGTAAAWWELDWPAVGASYLTGLYDAATAETTCGGDVQVGGACEYACWYYNAYEGESSAGAVLSTSLSGWGMTGSGAGTFCSAFSAASEDMFVYDEFEFFVCAAIPWKLCCRPPNYPYYPIISWPEPGLTPIVDQLQEYYEDLYFFFFRGAGGVARRPAFAKKMLSQETLAKAKAAKEGGNKNAGKPKPSHINRASRARRQA